MTRGIVYTAPVGTNPDDTEWKELGTIAGDGYEFTEQTREWSGRVIRSTAALEKPIDITPATAAQALRRLIPEPPTAPNPMLAVLKGEDGYPIRCHICGNPVWNAEFGYVTAEGDTYRVDGTFTCNHKLAGF